MPEQCTNNVNLFSNRSATRLHNEPEHTTCPPAIHMTPLPSRLARVAAWLALGLMLPAWSLADDRSDHNLARAAMESGQVLPLKTVLSQLERQRPGNVLEVELERKARGWVYEIKQLEAGGQLARIKLDAQTAQILDVRSGKPPRSADEREPNPR